MHAGGLVIFKTNTAGRVYDHGLPKRKPRHSGELCGA
jgi:hypothetical protein